MFRIHCTFLLSQRVKLFVFLKCCWSIGEIKHCDFRNPVTFCYSKNPTLSYHPQELDLNNSYTSTANSVPEEMFNLKPAKEGKKEKSKLVEIQQPKEEKQKNVEKLDAQKKQEEKHETNNEEVGTLKTFVLLKCIIQFE